MEAWDFTFPDQELQTIDAICESATATATATSYSSPIKRPHESTSADDESRRRSRRRLPDSLFIFQKQLSPSSSVFPCRKNSRFSYTQYQGNLRYPELAFKGRVLYSRTAKEVERGAEELLNFVDVERRKNEGQVVIGFDIEWRPTFKRGVAPGKAAVMQICAGNSHCHVMHIIHSGIPQKLQDLLEDPELVKAGVCIINDAFKVSQDYNVSVKSVEDLSNLANQKLGGAPKKWSLAALTETLVCKQSKFLQIPNAFSIGTASLHKFLASLDSKNTRQLPKPYKIRLGNWEASILSKEQLQYAATDAFVSWYLYQVLMRLPEAVDNKSEGTKGEPK